MPSRKTKAQLEAELAELRKQIKAEPPIEQAVQQDAKPVRSAFDPKSTLIAWLPTIIAVAVIGLMLLLQQRTKPDMPPGPEPEKTIEQIVAEVIPGFRKGYGEIFELAAIEIDNGQITTDKQLFDFVQPSLQQLRAQKQMPFDQMFDMALPRDDEGKLKAKEASDFLRRIAKSW